MKEFISKLAPKVNKKALLFLSGIAWSVAGIFLISKVLYILFPDNMAIFTKLVIAVPMGLIIYLILFRNILPIYIRRILRLHRQKYSIFMILSRKGYLVFIIMTSLMISLEYFQIINHDYILDFQLSMSIPLLLSAGFFFKEWKNLDI